MPIFFHSILHCQRIHDGGKHAHVVGGGAINACGGGIGAAPDIATTNHDGHLHTEVLDAFDFSGDTPQ